MRRGAEVIERGDTGDDRGKGGGDLRIAVDGVMRFAFDNVGVELGIEGTAELAGSAGKFDGVFGFADASDGEAVLLQPARNGGDFGIGGTIERAELLGSEPVVIAGTALGVGVEEELAERGGAFRGALEEKKHALGGKFVRNGALIELRLGEGVDIAAESDADTVVNGMSDAGERLSLTACRPACKSEEQDQAPQITRSEESFWQRLHTRSQERDSYSAPPAEINAGRAPVREPCASPKLRGVDIHSAKAL